MRERNKITDEDGKVEGRDYEWVELPSLMILVRRSG